MFKSLMLSKLLSFTWFISILLPNGGPYCNQSLIHHFHFPGTLLSSLAPLGAAGEHVECLVMFSSGWLWETVVNVSANLSCTM
jgi:hypothetical protein